MTKFLVLLLLIFSSQSAYFQTPENKKALDSLTILLRTKKEAVARLHLYHAICKEYYPYNKSQMIEYNNKLLTLSKEIQYRRGFGLYYLNLTDIDYIDGNLKKGILDGLKARAIFSKTLDTPYYLSAVQNLSYAYIDNLQSRQGREIILKDLNFALKTNISPTLGKLYYYLGISYSAEDKFKNAVHSYKKSLYYFEKSKNKNGKASIYFELSKIYLKMNLNKKALEYLDIAMSGATDDYNRHIIMMKKMIVYNNMGNYAKALDIAKENEVFYLKTKQKSSSSYAVNKIGLATSYYGLKNYALSIANAKTLLNPSIDADTRADAISIITDCLMELKRPKAAKLYVEQSILLVESATEDDTKSSIYLSKSQVEEALGNYKTALIYHKKYEFLKNRFFTKINEDKIQQLQTDFEVTEKNNRIKKLEISELQQKLNLKKQQNYITLISLILVIALLSIILFYKIYVTIKRKNNIIETNNIALSKAQLLTQKSLKEKELLLKEIHHRVKNNLQLVMSLLNIQAREGSTQSINDFLEKGQSRIVSMALIHQNLYQTERLDKVNFGEYTENLVESIKETFGQKQQLTSTVIQIENINFDIQTAIPLGLIINELFCNALKHAFPENDSGKVTISIAEKENKTFELTVSDNGVGIKNDPNAKKTLGLELVYLLADQLNGKITTENVDGTTFRILFKEVVA